MTQIMIRMKQYGSVIIRLIAFLLLFTLYIPSFAADGDVFTAKTVEGVEMTFKVISEADKTCQVGDGYSYNDVAIDRNYSGPITIPAEANGYSVTFIGHSAFSGCSGLTGSLTIPSSVISIDDGAFYNCNGLTGSLTIPNSVTSIGDAAFFGCSGLTGSLTIPNSVTSIGSSAFFGCRGLTGSLTIPNSVTAIGSSAFSLCTGLTGSLTIPNSVTSIGDAAFRYCSGINIVKSEIEEQFSISSDVFYSSPKHKTLNVPKGTKSKYMAFAEWTTYFANVLEDGETITYTFSITATGNGSATYNNTAVRGKTTSFTVNEGTSATITFTPDAGYRIANVKLNGTDVTSSVVSNKYTVSNISSNTTLSVTFEAITHTLSITASGNGNAIYNSAVIRDNTQAFTVNDGASATITFTPDAGYSIADVKVDPFDVTEKVAIDDWAWDGTYCSTEYAPDVTTADGRTAQMVEKYREGDDGVAETGILLQQTIEGLENGKYTVELYANAFYTPERGFGSDLVEGATNVAYLFANDAKAYIVSQIGLKTDLNGEYTIEAEVTDGKLTIGLGKDKGGTNWHTIQIKSLIFKDAINMVDVTESVVNNKYTISNITANTTLAVTFGAVTHKLYVAASGGGSAIYNNATIRDGKQTFTVNDGASATIKFAPDAGCHIARVMVDGPSDMTQLVATDGWGGEPCETQFAPAIMTSDGRTAQMMENYQESVDATGILLQQTIEGLENGKYTVELYANAFYTPERGFDSDLVEGATDVAYVFANDAKTYLIGHIGTETTQNDEYTIETEVTDGKLTIGLGKDKAGTNWHTIQIKSLTSFKGAVNAEDVTASVVNNKYTIYNITENTTLDVTFEAFTHTLSITASGNGSAIYNNTAVRLKTQTFTVNDGTSAAITFVPDAGCRVASVKVNGSDVTASVVNNKYTINNITTNTTLAVTFEPITHTLSVTVSGNGSAYCNNTTVRNRTEVFTVNEGTSATVGFTPDDGYRIASVKLNGTNVTADVADNKYTIDKITANMTLAVIFEAIPPTTYTLSITAIGKGSATYNNTVVKGKTQAFTVTEGTSATITFTPYTGYRISSVKVNNADVTASVANNSYTISNISANTTLAVTFEAIPPSTYLLNIVAVGNGSVSYNNTTIRNQSKEFTIVEKSAVSIMMSPDNGYRVASVKVNNTDVTSQVSNGQITISNIDKDTNVEVVFEEIPPTTYSLTITATGNGTVTYDGNTIRDNSSAFTVVEGSYVTVQITPDAGYRLKQVTLDGKDVTADVANGQYTTAKMMANTTLAVEFVEAVTELAYNGVNYRVVSQDGQTVNVASGNYGLTLTVPATFEAKGKTWTVTGIDNDALANATELAAVIWQPEAAFTAKVSNPNLLLYVTQSQYAPSDIQNVVVGDQAENIILTEAESGNNFYCPKAFTAKRISYEHNYSMTSGYKTCQGWETLVLPFDVTMMINAKGVELVPRSKWMYGSSLRTFWLYQLTDQGWQAADGIKANIPYILCMPNNEMYDASYNQTGNIQYIGNNVQVMASEGLKTGKYGNKQLVANYQNQAANNGIYALNVSNEWYQNTATEAEGSTFIRSLRNVHPFEAYMTVEGSNARAIPIFVDDNTTNLSPIPSPKGEGRDGWYDLQGRKLQNEPKQKGIYIYKGKKVKK